MKTIQPVKGTRDFYPEEMAFRTWLYGVVRRVSESFGYQEYEGPLLEPIELYAAKSGEELVNQQSFVFPDRGGNTITLRPELTPSLARMVAQRQGQLVFPLRWWSWGPFWRYERPQKGRGREFFQWNIDLIGANSAAADAELIAIAATFFKEVGLTPNEVNILVGNRRLMNDQFDKIGIPAVQRQAMLNLIDRLDKMSPDQWNANALENGLSPAQVEELREKLANLELWRESEGLVELFDLIGTFGIAEYIKFDPRIIRGLQYYTGTVFEAWDVAKEFRALFGGGRYDRLVSDVGGEPLPAIGFALGDMVIHLLLEKYNCLPGDLGRSPAQILVTIFDEASLPTSSALATQLRASGLNVALYPEIAKLAKQIRYADRTGIHLVVILGPEETAAGQVNIKDLRSGEQKSVPQAEAVGFVQETLASSPSS